MTKNKTTRFQKIKNKIKEDPEGAFFVTITGVVAVAITALTVYAVKEENRQARETKEWIKKENSKGNSVFQLIDGSLLSVPTPEYVNQV
jgi:hypothetical protein